MGDDGKRLNIRAGDAARVETRIRAIPAGAGAWRDPAKTDGNSRAALPGASTQHRARQEPVGREFVGGRIKTDLGKGRSLEVAPASDSSVFGVGFRLMCVFAHYCPPGTTRAATVTQQLSGKATRSTK